MSKIAELEQKGQELKQRIEKFGAPLGNKNAAGPHDGIPGNQWRNSEHYARQKEYIRDKERILAGGNALSPFERKALAAARRDVKEYERVRRVVAPVKRKVGWEDDGRRGIGPTGTTRTRRAERARRSGE